MWPFEGFLFVHIACGAVGLLLFWIPTLGKKGSQTHRTVGHWYARLMLVTASMAFCMSITTLLDPMTTHPKQVALDWPQWRVEGIFGWMMLGLAILTVNLAWYGLSCIHHRENHRGHREWRNLGLQLLLVLASVICLVESRRIGEPLMLGMPAIGIATVATNLWFIFKPQPARLDWLK